MSTQRRRATAAKFSAAATASNGGPATAEPQVTPPAPAATPSRPEPVESVRTTPVRRSVDLAPTDHFGLDAWCSELSADLGKRVTGVAVIRELIRMALDEREHAELRAEVRARLRKELSV